MLGGQVGLLGILRDYSQPFVLEGPQTRMRASHKALFLCVDYTLLCTGDYQISELSLIPRDEIAPPRCCSPSALQVAPA